MNKFFKKFFALAASVFFFSCGVNVKEPPQHTRWLVLVYMAADNNLSPFAPLNLDEMMSVGTNENVRILAFVDRGDGENTVYEVEKGWLKPIERLPNTNSASAAALEKFVTDALSRYSYDKLALILWDHGDGWRTKTVALDTSAFNGHDAYLFDFELVNALKYLKSQGVKFDVIGFDECLDAMAELLYDVSPFAKVIIASELTEPATGWNYGEFLSLLSSNPNATSFEFAKYAVDAYYRYYEVDPICSYSACELGAFNSSDIHNLIEAINATASNFTSYTSASYKAARENSTTVIGVSYAEKNYVDIGSFAQNLYLYSNSQDVSNCSQKLLDAVSSFYVRKTGTLSKAYSGVSVYFPSNSTDADTFYFCTEGNSSSCYGYFNPFTSTLWDNFLKSYLGI